ncbi:hypothetical protein CcCBS67573_g07575 [Chytriomyces confervae]|uniref:Alpha-methylacyl-CoA racemase n=1 Tax=Chytriomyces confervae TaxID=246404 RepID=A0A507EVC2_9FUNG|nr:hypothetical protein CcCBS67573_g07575 [Chytriomyces confervae]
MASPLSNVNVVEFAGLAPVPFAGMVLADFGASVVRIDRLPGHGGISADVMGRGKKSVSINLRSKKGIELAKKLIAKADVVLDPFRPGVMESLGLSPDVIQGINPRCIFARLTGFGQTGELSRMAGHDINYIAVSGALSPLGRSGENPMAPANILGDFAGGGMLCVMGILMALLERNKSGKGQVIDSAMVDGAAYLSTFLVKMNQGGMWNNPRGTNMLDTGAHFYETYRTKDGRFMAVGAIEPQFYKALLKGLGLPVEKYANEQLDMESWEPMKRKFAEIFATKTRDEWSSIFTGTDACVTPVLEWDEAMKSKHYQDRWGVATYEQWTPPPAPILSRTPGKAAVGDPKIGGDTRAILEGMCGLDANAVDELVRQGVVGESVPSRDSKL